MQNLLFFHLFTGLIAVAVTVAFVVETVRNPNTVLVKTPAICSLCDMYVIQDSAHYSTIYFLSRETDIWVEREKKAVVVEKIYISKK